ncbi:hypothetical protein [Cephaloticoccus primus]|nr:hypothetical protein [Cephaloticoccus primus]
MASSNNTAPVRATWICLGLAWAFYLLPIPGLSGTVGSALCLATFILSIIVMCKGEATSGLIPMLLVICVSPIVYFIGLGIMSMFVMLGVSELAEIPVPQN